MFYYFFSHFYSKSFGNRLVAQETKAIGCCIYFHLLARPVELLSISNNFHNIQWYYLTAISLQSHYEIALPASIFLLLLLTKRFPFLADIIFIVKDKEHPSFRRDGNDLIYTTSLPLGKVTRRLPA